jgi:hypothetical protein
MKRITSILAITAGCTMVMVTLYSLSPIHGKVYKGAFTRKMLPDHFIKLDKIVDLEVNSYYIAGTAKDNIFLGNHTAPLLLVKFNRDLEKKESIRIQIEGIDEGDTIEPLQANVWETGFALSNGQTGRIVYGKSKPWIAKNLFSDSVYFFTTIVHLKDLDFIVRSYNNITKSYELAKISPNTPHIKFNTSLLNRQIDGLFCLEGTMTFNSYHGTLVYAHRYRNELVLADSNLNLIKRATTLDTISHARVTVSEINDNTSVMSTTPPQQNLNCATDGDYIFVNSNVLSKSEDDATLDNKSIIDIFKIQDGSYVGSFYIPYYKSNRINSMLALNSSLITMNGQYMNRYTLKTEYINKTLSTALTK